MNQKNDRRIVSKIHDLVNRGVTNVEEMCRHIREFVRNELFVGREMPPSTSRQYFPAKKDIYNHMYQAVVKNLFSNCDQTNVEAKVKNWKQQHPQDKFLFRQYRDVIETHETSDESGEGEHVEEEVREMENYTIGLKQNG